MLEGKKKNFLVVGSNIPECLSCTFDRAVRAVKWLRILLAASILSFFLFFFVHLLGIFLVHRRSLRLQCFAASFWRRAAFRDVFPPNFVPSGVGSSLVSSLFPYPCVHAAPPPNCVCGACSAVYGNAPWIKVRSDHKRGGKVVLR